MAFDTKQLVTAINDVKGILMVAGVAFIIAMVMLILVGVFGGLIADGTIGVPSATNVTIQSIVTLAGTVLTTTLGVITSIVGFVIIFVLLKAFGINININSNKRM